tara:strand:+ start:1959 stop:2981 length:1023 start_codon:yes stop_codon:yes gene_type:complete
MNIIIIGLGSIGQRHLRNIYKIKGKTVNFYAVRQKFSSPNLSKFNKPLKSSIKKKYKIRYLHSLNEIKNLNITFHSAFICNPTSMHLENLIWLLKHNINVFIEKPISHNLRFISQLKKLIKKSKSITMMGYQYRFDPIINFLKNENRIKNLIGNLNFVAIDHGEDVRNFHSWENYENSYTSKNKLGGGVTLCQIHEFEYFQNIFEKFKIKKFKSVITKTSSFNIDVDDTSSHIFLLNKNRLNVLCNINLNFYENPKNRTIKFIGEKGKIIADLNKQKIKVFKNEKIKNIKFRYNRNDLFLKEIKYFFKIIQEKNKKNKNSATLGIKNLEFVYNLFKNAKN